MSIRWFTALLLIISLAISFTSAYVITVHGQAFLTNYFLILLPTEPVALFQTLLLAQLLALLLCAVVIAFFAYLIFSLSIARPLVLIMKSMDSFTKGEESTLRNFIFVPKEISNLANIFRVFSTNVTTAHTHDVEISRVKSDFISTAAHQLRTPLTGIKWSLEALEQSELTVEQKEIVAEAVIKSRDLVAIVGTLLDISAIESGKYNYTFASINIGSLCAEVVSDFAQLAIETNVTLTLSPFETEIPYVHADKDRIKWVLNNLIENAIRYTPADGFVTCTVRQTLYGVEVTVRDTGIGIKNQDKNNIFERFYRAGNAITKENKGSGLGLYIARTIATDHGGDLTFSANTDGSGTSFKLSLPVAR